MYMYILIACHIRPKDLKFGRQLLFPKKGIVFDFLYKYNLSYASWTTWSNLLEKVDIEDGAQVWPSFSDRGYRGWSWLDILS